MTTAEMAELIFRMYAQRWSIEDTFKTAKATLGLESVQVLDYNAIRRLEALGWVALGYRLELGVTLDWPEVRLLQRLGVERTGRTGRWGSRSCAAACNACSTSWRPKRSGPMSCGDTARYPRHRGPARTP